MHVWTQALGISTILEIKNEGLGKLGGEAGRARGVAAAVHRKGSSMPYSPRTSSPAHHHQYLGTTHPATSDVAETNVEKVTTQRKRIIDGEEDQQLAGAIALVPCCGSYTHAIARMTMAIDPSWPWRVWSSS